MGERKPGQKWTVKDTLLALSLTQYEDGLCRGCGQPLALAHASDGNPGHGFSVEKYTCNACQELELDENSKMDASQAGVKRYASPE